MSLARDDEPGGFSGCVIAVIAILFFLGLFVCSAGLLYLDVSQLQPGDDPAEEIELEPAPVKEEPQPAERLE